MPSMNWDGLKARAAAIDVRLSTRQRLVYRAADQHKHLDAPHPFSAVRRQ